MKRSYSLDDENRQIFKLYWPILIEQGLTMLIGIISTIMVSNVGDYTVSGVNLVDQINFMVISVFNALAAGATVVIAKSIGAGKAADAGKTANQSVVLCVFVSAIRHVPRLDRQVLRVPDPRGIQYVEPKARPGR